MGEIFFIVSLVGFLVLPFLFLQGEGRIFWVITMSAIGAIVGISELLSKMITGLTISKHFWAWSLKHRRTAWIVLGLLLLGWLSLLIHLAWKMLFS